MSSGRWVVKEWEILMTRESLREVHCGRSHVACGACMYTGLVMITALVGDILASGNWYEQATIRRRQLICGVDGMLVLVET